MELDKWGNTSYYEISIKTLKVVTSLKKIMAFLLAAAVALLLFVPQTAYARDLLKNEDPDKYYILLDLKNQIVTVYEKDGAGAYTKIVRSFLCSSGTNTPEDPLDPEDIGKPTPTGIYKIGGKERFGKFTAFGGTYARYWTQIVGNIYFHSIMFSKRDINTLQSGAFSGLGNPRSHGCVRLYVEDAKWLYYHAASGTTIKVSDTEPKNNALKKALKTSLSFKDYNAFQKAIYDIPELPNKTAYVVYNNALVRKGAGTGENDGGLFRLPIDSEVEVLQEGNPWYKIKYENREGYILASYLSYEKGVTTAGDKADLIKATTYMFTAPDLKSAKIVKVPAETSVQVLETTTDGWSKIVYSNEIGYIKTNSLKKGWGFLFEKAEPSASPSPAPSPSPPKQ
ncbi:MAG: L,D-transpeptidase family protein [Christensenellales bacterium]